VRNYLRNVRETAYKSEADSAVSQDAAPQSRRRRKEKEVFDCDNFSDLRGTTGKTALAKMICLPLDDNMKVSHAPR
jgi:hypothetical protein